MNDRGKKLKKFIKIAIMAAGYVLLLTALFKIGAKIELEYLKAKEARAHDPKVIIAKCVSDLSQKTLAAEDDADLSTCEGETQKKVSRTRYKDIAPLKKHSRNVNALMKSLSDKQYTAQSESEQFGVSQP